MSRIFTPSFGAISLLPALPKAWPTGSATGLRARGGVEVDLAWHNGRLLAAILKSSVDGPQRIRVPTGSVIADVRSGDRAVEKRANRDGLILFDSHADEAYRVRFD